VRGGGKFASRKSKPNVNGLSWRWIAPEHIVVGDNVRIQQVLWNLLKNASKFTQEGGEIRVTSRNETSLILVEISDTGIGSSLKLSAIFNAFTQGSEGIAREFGGLGLGLTISRATV